MTPAVASIVNSDLPKVVPGLCWRERRATMDGTEQVDVVTQFNEFLMSRLYPCRTMDKAKDKRHDQSAHLTTRDGFFSGAPSGEIPRALATTWYSFTRPTSVRH